MTPDHCKRDGNLSLTINAPSGAVMTCDSYDDSYPDMTHSWAYCGPGHCDQVGVNQCMDIQEQSGIRFLAEQG